MRYRGNDYSVPTAYGHREVLIRGYVESVVIACGAEIIARHVRSYEREDFVFDPLHYLALLERKTGAFDQAAPLAGWDLPEVFALLRRLPGAPLQTKIEQLDIVLERHADDLARGAFLVVSPGQIHVASRPRS